MARTTNSARTLEELVAALQSCDAGPSTVTSIRQPAALQRATKAAVVLGWASNANEGMTSTLFAELSTFAFHLGLESHFAAHPETRPSLAEVAQALARLEDDPLVDDVELIQLAATEIVQVRPRADANDVLVWAASLRRHGIGV